MPPKKIGSYQVVVDVGKSLAKYPKWPHVQLLVRQFVQQRMLYYPKDEVGIVLVGTDATDNPMAEGDESYNHISIARHLSTTQTDILKVVDSLEVEGSGADPISGLLVASADLIANHKTSNGNILLITDCGSAKVENADQFGAIAQELNSKGIRVTIVGLDFADDDGTEPTHVSRTDLQKENEKALRSFAEELGSDIFTLDNALALLTEFRKKDVKPTTTFRGNLQISESLGIPVYVYKKVGEAKFPTLKKASKIAIEEGCSEIEMKLDRKYVLIEDDGDDKEIEPEDRIKAYKYGKQYIPFSEMDANALKFTCEKCLTVLGFAKEDQIPRAHLMGEPSCVVPQPEDGKAATALAGLIQAMVVAKKVAIVRYSYRTNAEPKLCAIYAVKNSEEEAMYMLQLPTCEDLRFPVFGSFDNPRKAEYKPSAEQLAAAEGLISSMDLMVAARDDDGDPTEALDPQTTFNPAIQRFNQNVCARAVDNEAPICSLDPIIERYVCPDKDLLDGAKDSLASFANVFPLGKRGDSKEKLKKRSWIDAIKNEESDEKSAKMMKLEGESSVMFQKAVSYVRATHAEEDFEAMLAGDQGETAIQQMKTIILQLVEASVKAAKFPRALACLKALRKGACQIDDALSFNDFLREVRSNFEEGSKKGFWELITNDRITLISSSECDDKNAATPQEAESFLKGPAPVSQSAPTQTQADDEDDDLLDDF